MLRGEFDNLLRLANPTVLAGIHADDVTTGVADEFLRVDEVEADVVGHHLGLGLALHAGEGGVVAIRCRLFAHCQVAVFQ